MKTIVSLSTPRMNSAIHIIRISGCDSFAIVQKIVDKKITKKGYQIQRVNIVDKKKIIDDVILLKFIAPNSFTGEDVIEINCHGGFFLAQKIINLLIKSGCVLAKAGEFSERAFLNKKISLIDAQAINNLINATNDKAIDAANNKNNKKVFSEIKKIRNYLFKIVGQLEVNIDYPEYEDEPVILSSKMKKFCTDTLTKLSTLVFDSKLVIPYRDGINVSIIGKPNVGKSSILNSLLGESKAIVSEYAGTTRDIVDAKINIEGITINFFDTAGIRETKNKIEKIGIAKTKEAIAKSDLVLLVIDNSKKINKEDKDLINLLKNKNHIVVKNKSDISQENNIKGIVVSAKNNDLKKLISEIVLKIKSSDISFDNLEILQTTQSISIIENCVEKLKEVVESIDKKESLDSQLSNLHSIIDDLNSVIGESSSFDFINEMFRNFCVGK